MGGTKIFRYMLTSLEDQPWKDVRSAVSPTFTSGKIKQVIQLPKLCFKIEISFIFNWVPSDRSTQFRLKNVQTSIPAISIQSQKIKEKLI